MLRTALSHRAQLATARFTRSCRRRGAISRWRASARPAGPACSSPPRAAARAATSSSAGASCCSICRGNRRPSSSASDGSTASAAACRWKSSTSARRAASAPTPCGCSKRWGCSASRWRAWSRSWRTWRTRSTPSPATPRRRLSDAASAVARRRRAGGAHAHSRSGVPAAAPRSVPAGDGAGLLARVPADLDALTQDVVVTACARLGFTVEHTRGRRVFAIELGSDALVDSLPGVRSGSTYVGSFDREEAVEDETIDFFASGHPLVEGVLAHFEDARAGPRGAHRARDGTRARRRPRRHLQGRPRLRGRRLRCRRAARAPTGPRRCVSGRWR